MMKELAAFEGYIGEFAVTRSDLLRLGLQPIGEAHFHCIVAEIGETLAGYALTYLVPFTYDLRPTLVLKELFVADTFRSKGIGQRLFFAVIEYGRSRDARLLRWQVLPGNDVAKRFYRNCGGGPDRAWESWLYEL
jgi:GNAT superfamily N-acetyltransferase